MNRLYDDIISKMGEPLWYDGLRVPRYVEFHPRHTGVYDTVVVLFEIKCQQCARKFRVAREFDTFDMMRLSGQMPPPEDAQFAERLGRFLHWGDPPRHGGEDCPAGDTMNSIPVRVLQWWVKSRAGSFAWERKPEFEVEIPEDEE